MVQWTLDSPSPDCSSFRFVRAGVLWSRSILWWVQTIQLKCVMCVVCLCVCARRCLSGFTGMRRITTFRSTTDRIYDGAPVRFFFFFFFFFFFSSTTLCEFWLAQLFLSISSSPASFVSNYSLPSPSSHSSRSPPILLLAFPSVSLHTVSIWIWSWPFFHWSFFLHAPTSPVVCILYILLYFRY